MSEEKNCTPLQTCIASVEMGMFGAGLGTLLISNLALLSNNALKDTVTKSLYLICSNASNVINSHAYANVTQACAEITTALDQSAGWNVGVIAGATMVGVSLVAAIATTCWNCGRKNPETNPLLSQDPATSGNELGR